MVDEEQALKLGICIEIYRDLNKPRPKRTETAERKPFFTFVTPSSQEFGINNFNVTLEANVSSQQAGPTLPSEIPQPTLPSEKSQSGEKTQAPQQSEPCSSSDPTPAREPEQPVSSSTTAMRSRSSVYTPSGRHAKSTVPFAYLKREHKREPVWIPPPKTPPSPAPGTPDHEPDELNLDLVKAELLEEQLEYELEKIRERRCEQSHERARKRSKRRDKSSRDSCKKCRSSLGAIKKEPKD